jgi:hypothetical protein
MRSLAGLDADLAGDAVRGLCRAVLPLVAGRVHQDGPGLALLGEHLPFLASVLSAEQCVDVLRERGRAAAPDAGSGRALTSSPTGSPPTRCTPDLRVESAEYALTFDQMTSPTSAWAWLTRVRCVAASRRPAAEPYPEDTLAMPLRNTGVRAFLHVDAVLHNA